MKVHQLRRKALLGTVAVATMTAGALLPVVSAYADPKPGIGEAWPMCGTAPDDDGKYCILSQTKNGVPITRPGSGTFEEPYIDLIGSGDVRFGVQHTNVDTGVSDGDVPPGDTYELVVNTGSIRPREVFGHIRGVTYSTAGNATSGYTFTLSFRPTPIAWVWPPDTRTCVVGSCGDDTTMADLTYDGFVTGYVTDLASSGLPASEIDLRTGFVHVYNAQDANLYYDPDSNALVVQLANPHLKAPGVVATGSYQTFIPYAMLTGLMNVPAPSSLTGGSFVVSRSLSGSTTTVPFTLTHTAAGVRINITGITYSSPTYRIRPKKTPPGAPRLRRVERATPTSVRVRFRAPVADGGASVTEYRARCRRLDGAWHRATRSRSPIVVRNVPRRTVTCYVRAVNRIGAGPWSTGRSG